jgi:hypothetical protein
MTRRARPVSTVKRPTKTLNTRISAPVMERLNALCQRYRATQREIVEALIMDVTEKSVPKYLKARIETFEKPLCSQSCTPILVIGSIISVLL